MMALIVKISALALLLRQVVADRGYIIAGELEHLQATDLAHNPLILCVIVEVIRHLMIVEYADACENPTCGIILELRIPAATTS
jgi:hypothetical protein